MGTTRYARAGDLNIAYQVDGDAPRTVVYVGGFMSHLELMWEVPAWKAYRARLGRFSRFVCFDKRGVGMSDRITGGATVEDRMDDIGAVMDAVGVERAAIIGMSEGGPIAAVFAATYPERVESLVLQNAMVTLRASQADPLTPPQEALDALLSIIDERWGDGFTISLFAPQTSSDASMMDRTAQLERFAATPASAAAIMRINYDIDIRAVLPTVTVPTLVLHRIADPMVSVTHGRYAAAHIPGARLVELGGAYHVGTYAGEEDDTAAEIEEFLTGERHEVETDRILATVLFTDIVGSTERAAALGDARWHALLDEHDGVVRRQLERFRGREVNTTGDGFLAAFDGPARAVRCARAIAEEARRVGIDIRAGVHTGECEVRGDDLAGIAVHIGARVAAQAGPGEVLVSSTVRDLVAGSGLSFEERGAHELKGVPGTWSLLAVTAG